jgi:transcriptional regulator with XRE-family HTH domain
MLLVAKIKILCEQKGITLTELERKVGIGRSTIRNWDKSSPTTDKLQKVADYFNVSIDYLLGRDYENRNDIAKAMEKIKWQLMTEQSLMFDGKILDKENKTLLIEGIEREIRIMKRLIQ